jgi:protein O-mannosyl-transferase
MLSQKNAVILSLLIVILCYANSVPNDFVFDDVAIIGSNLAVRNITPLEFLKSPYWAEQAYGGIYRPFTIFSLSVDYAIWQNWAPGFRITNLLIHALNGWLLFLLCQSLFKTATNDRYAKYVPFAAMVIYLAHPVHTEAVISIVGRSELFATCFFLSAWLLFRRGKTLAAAGVFFLSLLSKENAIVLPAVLALDVWLSQGIDIKKVFAAWKRLAVIGVVAVAYLALRFSVLGGLGIPVAAQYMGGKLSYLERWMTSGRVLFEYLRLIVAPLDVAGDYDFNAIPLAGLADWDAWLGFAVLGGALALAYFYRRRNWVMTLGILFAVTAYIPVSNWIMPISILMAERSLYLPLVGLAIAGGILFAEIPSVSLRRVVAIGWVVTAILLCIDHTYIWRNDFTFFRNMVRVQPESAKARLGYGFTLLGAGMKDDAAFQLQEGLRILPDYPALLSTLALTKMTQKTCDDAWPLLRRALQVNPKHGDSLRRVADCLYREGEIEKAEAMYRKALEYIAYPDSLLLFMWGKSLEETGQKVPAIAAYEKAALIDPKNVLIKQKLESLGAGATSTP